MIIMPPTPNWDVIPNVRFAPLWYPRLSMESYWKSGQHYADGGTQPWVQALLYQLVRSCGFRRVMEFGTWYGATSAWLCMALTHNGGGCFWGTERDHAVADKAAEYLFALQIPDVDWVIRRDETLVAMEGMPFAPEFVFLDDDKGELEGKFKLLPPGTLVAVHDAEAVPELAAWPRIVLKTPVLHGSGHLALIQL